MWVITYAVAMSIPNFRTLDLNLLRVFDEVMAERSLTRAARNLSLTQPAVSNALRRLRDALDDELSESLPYAYSSDWGYLTCCPTNTGTGMRASVMAPMPNVPASPESTMPYSFILAIENAISSSVIRRDA